MMYDFPPGVAHEISRRRNQINWREANLMRWDNATLVPVGGWEKMLYSGFETPIRVIHRWNDNTGVQHTAFLCEQHCYVDPGDGNLIDITPEGGLPAPAAPGEGGYGDDDYGTDDYGEPRTAAPRINKPAPGYFLDNWGQELRAMTSADGRLLRWDPSNPGDPLEPVTGAPTGNKSFIVTPERHVMLFGVNGDDHRFEWSDEEDDSDWTPGTTSKAGGFSIEPASPIMARFLAPFGVTVFTARSLYIARHVGLPYVYGYERVTDCPPPISQAAVATTPDGVFWASINGFWVYNGVTAAPAFCPIWNWIQRRIDRSRSRFTASMVNIAPRFEVWFFFAGSDDYEYNNFVAIYNYRDNWWSMGEIRRTCGVSSPNDPNPIMATHDEVFRHETGWHYPGAGMPWIESHTFNSGGGSRLTTVKQMLPEISGGASSVQYRFVKHNNPTTGAETVSTPKLVRPNGYVDVRETARDLRMRLEMVTNVMWTQGPIDIEMIGRGKK